MLFLLNGLGAGALAILLVMRRSGAGTAGAVGAILLSAGALVALVLSMSDGGLFDYVEPAFRPAVVVSLTAEAAAVALLLGYLAARRAPRRPRVDWTAT